MTMFPQDHHPSFAKQDSSSPQSSRIRQRTISVSEMSVYHEEPIDVDDDLLLGLSHRHADIPAFIYICQQESFREEDDDSRNDGNQGPTKTKKLRMVKVHNDESSEETATPPSERNSMSVSSSHGTEKTADAETLTYATEEEPLSAMTLASPKHHRRNETVITQSWGDTYFF